MTDFTDGVLVDEHGNIIAANGMDLIGEVSPSGNLSMVLTSGNPVHTERGIADRAYKAGQIEVHSDGGFLVMADNYAAGDTYAASIANSTAVYEVANYNGEGFSRGDNIYVELVNNGQSFDSALLPYYGITSVSSATTRFLGRAEKTAPSGSQTVFVRTMQPRFGA